MHILYLAHRIPYPPNKGDKIRSFNEIKYLSRSHKIDLICLTDDKDALRYQKDLEEYCERVFVLPFNTTFAKIKGLTGLLTGNSISVGYFYYRRVQEVFDSWLAETPYNAIICFSSPMAEYVFRSNIIQITSFRASQLSSLPASQPPSIPASPRQPKLVCDFCDLDSDKWRQYSEQVNFPFNCIYQLEFRRLLQYEKKVNKAFDDSIFVSQMEADLFLQLYPTAKNVTVIPNGVDSKYFSPDATAAEAHSAVRPELKAPNRKPSTLSQQQPVLLFIGAMDYYANIDGVIWFHEDIFPLVQKEFPNAQFYIVGSNPTYKVQKLNNNSGTKVTGAVTDIRPYYVSADISVVPLRIARGVQNKVLEAMAMERPAVVTTKAVQGISGFSESNLLVADKPIEIAAKICVLLRDNLLRKQIGNKAREFVQKNYHWESNIKMFENLLGDRMEENIAD